MKIIFILFSLSIIFSCDAQSIKTTDTTPSIECTIYFSKENECNYRTTGNTINVKVLSKKIDDEKYLKKLMVLVNNHTETLNITHDTSMLDGDLGYISFEDINFDGVPDLAITTSFGTPNLYLDYWIYNGKTYSYLGNYPKFIIDKSTKSLSATVKIDSQHYEHKLWQWKNNHLVKQ